MNHARGLKHNLLIDIVLTPLTWLSGSAIALLDFLRGHGFLKTDEPSLPLISVGNITYGGTNKTPFVEMLARYALAHGVKPGIVTRGYSGRSHEVMLIQRGRGDRELAGDEPLLLSCRLPEVPVAVSKHRVDGVKALRDAGAELVIADDAFQHKSLDRDADIVLVDSLCPFGSGKLIPAGIMREKTGALSRADMVVLTKSDQVSQESLNALSLQVMEHVKSECIFTSGLEHEGWLLSGNDGPKTGDSECIFTSSLEHEGCLLSGSDGPKAGDNVYAFSAIGSPESFALSLKEYGLVIVGQRTFTDHHKYTHSDLEALCLDAKRHNAKFMICTEKDLYNLPDKSWPCEIPLAVPKVRAVLNEPERFFAKLTDTLRPKIIIASNGYGEDAIGVELAKRFRRKLPQAGISAFPLVGRGDAYLREGFSVKSAPSVTPSGGVLKYSLKDLIGDMRAGLLRHVRAQLRDWKKIAHSVRSPVCVGDVYLLLHTLWGSGKRPMFAATAKTVYLSGHWRLERAIISRFTLRTWARDEKSALQLGRHAVYSGSPVMDLLGEDIHEHEKGNVILLLPGSRMRACRDVKLLLDAADILSSEGERDFRMVLAPTLPADEFMRSCENFGWTVQAHRLTHNQTTITLTHEAIAYASRGVKILIGLGGTANQLCAGLGIPVVSIDEKGKRVQKKLLGGSEILVEASGEALAECVIRVLNDERLYDAMSEAGRERMGKPGALDDIVKYACDNLGWDIRESVYMRLKARNITAYNMLQYLQNSP